MLVVDAQGLPVAVKPAPAHPHESPSIQPRFGCRLTTQRPECIIGDKAYDRDPLDAELAAQGIERIIPHRSNRRPKNKTQDGRKRRRYAGCRTVQRTLSGLQNVPRLCIRWEKPAVMLTGFVPLGCACLLLK